MRVNQITIKRVREIEELTINCGHLAMVALVGENGSGKTTVFFSLLYAMTGVLILKGSTDEHVRDSGTGPSWAQVAFSENGEDYVIRRYLSESKVKLSGGALEKPLTGARKIASYLADTVGLDTDKLLRAFLTQGEADALFVATDAERDKLVHRIFGLQGVVKLEESLRDFSSMLNNSIDTSLPDRLADTKTHLEQANLNFAHAEGMFTEAESLHKEILWARDIANRATTQQQWSNRMSAVEALLARVQEQIEPLNKRMQASKELAASLSQYVSNVEPKYREAQRVLARASESEEQQKKRDELQLSVNEITASLDADRTALAEVPEFDQDAVTSAQAIVTHNGKQIEDFKTALKQLESAEALNIGVAVKKDSQVLQGALSVIENSPTPESMQDDYAAFSNAVHLWEHQLAHLTDGKCATCGQQWVGAPAPEKLEADIGKAKASMAAITAAQAKLQTANETRQDILHQIRVLETQIEMCYEQLPAGTEDTRSKPLDFIREFIAEIESQIREAQDKLASQARIAEQRSALEQQIEGQAQRVSDLTDALSGMGGEPPNQDEVIAAEDMVQAFEEKSQASRGAQTTMENDKLRLEELQLEEQGHMKEIEDLKANAVVEASVDDVSKAEKLLQDEQEVVTAYDVAKDQLAGAKTQLDIYTAQLEDLETKMSRQKRLYRKLEAINGARYILGRDQLLLYASSYYCQLVSAQWAEELSQYAAKFVAWQAPETREFHARFESGAERRAYQLSGGERQLAMVAYLKVINKLFAPELGILGFDEPTTHVDADCRPRMADVFRQLAERAATEDMQIFIVDHAPEFLAAIPSAIRLQKAS